MDQLIKLIDKIQIKLDVLLSTKKIRHEYLQTIKEVLAIDTTPLV